MENIKLDEKAHERMETILTKIAKEHSIDNVTAIDISLSKDTGLIKFKTAENPVTPGYKQPTGNSTAVNDSSPGLWDSFKQHLNSPVFGDDSKQATGLTPQQRDSYYQANPNAEVVPDATIQQWLQGGQGPLQSQQNPPQGQGWFNQVQQTVKNTIPTQPKQPDTMVTDNQGKKYYKENTPEQNGQTQVWDIAANKKVWIPTSSISGNTGAAGTSTAANPATIVPGAAPAAGNQDMTAKATSEGLTAAGVNNFGTQIFKDQSGNAFTYYNGNKVPYTQMNQAPTAASNTQTAPTAPGSPQTAAPKDLSYSNENAS